MVSETMVGRAGILFLVVLFQKHYTYFSPQNSSVNKTTKVIAKQEYVDETDIMLPSICFKTVAQLQDYMQMHDKCIDISKCSTYHF